jgi:lysophospholipase L1-like esterase
MIPTGVSFLLFSVKSNLAPVSSILFTGHDNVQNFMTRLHFFLVLLVATSSLFAPLTPAIAQNIFIAGDSTASAYGPDRYPRMGWGQVLGEFYGSGIRVVDLAQSGRSAKSFIDEGFYEDLESQLGADDILLIQFAHNDQKIHSPERYAPAETTFREYLGRYISLAREKNATPVLLTPVVRRKFEGGNLIPTHGKYPAAIRELAQATDVPLIDVTRLSGQLVAGLGEQESKAIYLHLMTAEKPVEDNTHFSERGAYAMAALVARELERLKIAPVALTTPDFIQVKQDGGGDFVRIQDAINSLDGTHGHALILVGPGEFEEKLFLKRDNITIAGAGRERTTIRTTQLRADWRKTHDDDWGAATVNIKASDITLMNLTVINDYGIRHGDNTHQHNEPVEQAGRNVLSPPRTF